MKHHLPPDQQRDYQGYTDAIERLETSERLKRKRQKDDTDHEVITFDWGPFHFWKRPPTPIKAPFGGWSVRCHPHHIAATDGTPEVDCKRECNLRSPGDEQFVIRRLKMWSLGYCCCENKAKHFKYMREYPSDEDLFTTEAAHPSAPPSSDEKLMYSFPEEDLLPPALPLRLMIPYYSLPICPTWGLGAGARGGAGWALPVGGYTCGGNGGNGEVGVYLREAMEEMGVHMGILPGAGAH